MEEDDTEPIALETNDTYILGTGHMDGSLEDAMYGLYDGDEASWSLRTALTNDRLADSRSLTTIHSPTHDKPFRFLGVKWFETAIPSVISAFARKRDTLVLGAMGLTTDEYGVPYGYYVLNVYYQHPSIPELSDIGIIRSKLSICYIFRHASFGCVSIYARGSVDVGGGDLTRRVGVILAAESIALTAKAIDTAHAKKPVKIY